MDCPSTVDNTFGPQFCSQFDFTLLFEQSFFQIAPCALLLLSLPWRASQLHRQNVKTARTSMRTVKQTAIALLAATQFALLIVWSVTPMYRTKASIPAALLSFLASLGLLYLSSIEHTRTVRPSETINVYILFSLLFDVPQARTLWLRSPTVVPGIFTAGMATKAVILYLEARSKRRSLLPAYRLFAPEALVSLYDRTVLWWINPLFVQGYKSVISYEKLFAIDSDLAADENESAFNQSWSKRSKSAKRPLLWAMIGSQKATLLAMLIPRYMLSAFRLSQPLLINRVTSWLAGDKSDVNAGRGLIGATALIYLGIALLNALFKRQLDRFITKTRSMVISAVHAKSLTLSADKLHDGAALTHVSTDVTRITFSLELIDSLLATPLEIAAAIFLLERQISYSCIAPVLFVLFISGISFVNSNSAVPIQKKWLAAIQTRIAYTAAVLGCPKGFKMLGLTEYLSDHIQALRVQELVEYAEYRKYVTWRNVFGALPEALAPAFTLMMFTAIQGDKALTPNVAFTSLSLVSLLTHPIQNLIFAVPMVQQALSSLERVQEFLLLEETGIRPSGPSETDDTEDGIELTTFTPKRATSSITPMVSFDNVSIKLGKEDKTILSDISFSALPQTVNFIVGPVGSGKSTLLRAIIGDIEPSKGQRTTSTANLEFGFCSQDPWLPNATVREIVTSESPFEQPWYSTVIQACALTVDIASFPSEDETVIGSKGVSLSGGQRQRLALARALYSRKTILVLDDILSGLDARSSKHVVDHVLGQNGLCKKDGITVVMATHAVNHFHRADRIVVLEEGGRIVEQGTFTELQSRGGYIHKLQLKGIDDTSEGHTEDAPLATEPVIARQPDDQGQQDLARRTGDTALYAYYLKSVGWFLATIVTITSILDVLCSKLAELWVRWWSESEVTGNGTHTLVLWNSVNFLLGTLSVIFIFAHIWVMLIYTVPKSSAKLHHQLLHSVMNAPYTFFVKTDVGITLNRFSNDMSILETQLAGAIMQTQGGVARCIGGAILIAAGARYVGVIMPFVLGILWVLQKYYLRTSRQLRFMDLEAQAPLLAYIQETTTGVTTIRAFGWQRESHEKCQQLLDRSQKPFYLMRCIQRWLNLVLDLITGAMATVVVALAMTLSSTASAGSVGLSLLNILTFNFNLSFTILAWTTLETSLGAIARCKNFEASTPSENLPGEDHEPSSSWPSKGDLAIKNLTMSYSPDSPPVLHNINLTIPSGTKVGIVGRSGSGKSSLLLALLRLIDPSPDAPSEGSITLATENLFALPRSTIRTRLTALPQEALCVPGSVHTNLDPLGEHTESDALAALEKVGLASLIASRGGLTTSLADLGLSAGERQLFAVARAVLRPSPVLLVDEMTSAVDAGTEERMLRVVREAFAASTVLAVAHRLKTVVDFDLVVVLDKGRVVESGAPKELFEREDGWFRGMWERDN